MQFDPWRMAALTALAAVFAFGPAQAMQDSDDAEAAAETASDDSAGGQDDDTKKDKTLAEMVEGHDAHEGLFTLYRDPESGDVHMAIGADQIGREYIYFTHTRDGVLEAGHFRGAFRDNAVFAIRRHFDRIEFVEQNTHFHFDPDNPLSRAADANISPAVLASAKIKAKSEDGATLLIDAGPLFRSEAFHQVSPTPDSNGGNGDEFKLGKLAKDRTAIRELRNYPENTDVIVDYVYANPKPKAGGSDAVTDARAVTVSMQHTLIAMPENDYTPRLDDPRLGYFFEKVTDLTSVDETPWRDLIHRWHLEKQDPTAAVSDVVEPIVFWIENTTPHELRDTIRDATLTWNEAFESAGFRNAVQVKVQPDDADWDAGDIRYNVLRWTSSPNPPFGGYGPSFVNPRTGQILGADIMLEHVFVSNRLQYEEIFDTAGLPVFPGRTAPENGVATCSLGHFLKGTLMYGRTVLAATGAPDPDRSRLLKEGLFYLTLHEVGHTLGLNHNMKASQLHPFDEINDMDATGAVGLTGSVMDYPAVNVAADKDEQGHFYTLRPGPYDHWAIRFGYAPEVDDPDVRAAVLAESTRPEHAFGNDADDMRAPGKAIDPRVMVGDMSGDAIAFAERQFAVGQDSLGKLMDRVADEGESWHALRNGYLTVTGQQASAANVISRYIGGVYVDRAFVGQETDAPAPFTPVPADRQQQALAALERLVFAPDAFDAPDDLLNHLQQRRRGFEFFNETEDPKIHDRILQIQDRVLAHLTHPNVVKRITDSSLYGNAYGLTAMMGDLTDAVFEADLRGDVNTRRQNLQLAYVDRLGGMLVGKSAKGYDRIAQSNALAMLERIDGWMEDAARRGDDATRAHRRHVRFTIERILDADLGD